LSAVTGDEEIGVGHESSEGAGFVGIGGSDDGSDIGESAGAEVRAADFVDHLGDVFADETTVLKFQVLQVAAAGVAGFDEDEDASAVCCCGFQKGFERVAAHVGIDGQGVGIKRGGWAAEMGLGVGFGGGSDVAAFGVGDDEEAFFAGVGAGGFVGADAVGAEFFVEGDLWFADGDDVGDGVDDGLIELKKRECSGERGVAFGLDRGFGDEFGNAVKTWVEADANGVAFGADGGV